MISYSRSGTGIEDNHTGPMTPTLPPNLSAPILTACDSNSVLDASSTSPAPTIGLRSGCFAKFACGLPALDIPNARQQSRPHRELEDRSSRISVREARRLNRRESKQRNPDLRTEPKCHHRRDDQTSLTVVVGESAVDPAVQDG
jgi:hypothetical protein